MSIWSDFLTNTGHSVYKWTQYFPAYERHFGRYVNRPLTFLEIGCGEGGSAQMWKRYFGPYAQIVSIDIRPECAAFEENQIAVRIGSQDDPNFLASVLAEFGEPHIVLDDGSHFMPHVRASFSYLYPRVARDGIYAVEDLHTAYDNGYGGGLRREGQFIELCKNLIDELHAGHIGALEPTEFTRSTMSMHFYDGIVMFERCRVRPRLDLRIPPAGSLPY